MTEVPEEIAEESTEAVDTFFGVMVEDLRMRTTPNLDNSEVLTKLRIETELQYLHNRSDFTSTINIGGKARTEPWYEVTTLDGQFKGWVYGGGVQLIKGPSKPEITLTPERLVYSVEGGLDENLESILDLELPGSNTRFKGFYEYKPGLSGNRIIDGSIRLETRELIEESNLEIEIHIEGRYIDGKKDGAFTCTYYYPESEAISTLYFEASQNNCLWGFYYEVADGEVYAYREDQPSSCDFDFLRRQARPEL